jgi:hypothetical protein
MLYVSGLDIDASKENDVKFIYNTAVTNMASSLEV